MEKMGKNNKQHWRVLLLIILLLPCLFIAGCGNTSNQNSNSDGSVYTVIFYTGIGDEFNIPKQEIVDGNTVRKPIGFPTKYNDPNTNTTKQFIGWYSDPSCESQYLWKFETDEVHSNLTLYALWEDINV